MTLQYIGGTGEDFPATNAVGVFNLKTLLKAAGWTVTASSDGTTYNSSGDQITTGAAGANGMDNNGAWFAIDKNGVYLTIQRGLAGSTNNYRIKMARSPFSAGSPSATVTPQTANPSADEHICLGAGSDASPSFQALIGAAGTTRVKAAADDTTSDFYYVGFPTGGGNPNTALVLTGFDQHDTDVFPYAIYCTNSNHFLNSSMAGHGFKTFLPQGGGLPVIGTALLVRSAANTVVPVGAAADPITGAFGVMDIAVARAGGDAGGPCWKGFANMLKWVAVAGHATGDTYTLNSTRDLIIMRDVCLPWNGVAPTNGAASTDRTASELSPLTMTTTFSGAGGDEIAPVVNNWTASPIDFDDAVSVDVTDNLDELALAVVSATWSGADDVVYDGSSFTAAYNAASTVTPITNGLRFSIKRDDGWRANTTIKVTAIDENGNVTNASQAYTGPTDAIPDVSNYDPAPASPVDTLDPIEFDVTDDFDITQVMVFVQYPGRIELAALDGVFTAQYAASSSRSPITDGYTYTLLRVGGWLGPFTVRVLAKDDRNGSADESASWTAPLIGGGGGVDTTVPAIGGFSPPVGSDLAPLQPVSFQVTDNSALFRRIIVTALYPRTGIEEVVHDGESFVGFYQNASARNIIAGGWSYSVLRYGGWPSSPTFRIFAIDQGGNEAT